VVLSVVLMVSSITKIAAKAALAALFTTTFFRARLYAFAFTFHFSYSSSSSSLISNISSQLFYRTL
jgi:hypothetical protein